MRKKFLSAFMLGALTLAATSTFVSCKDYDGDISTIKADVSALQKSLEELKLQHTREINDLKGQLDAAKIALQAAIDKKADATVVAALADKVTAIDNRLSAAEAQLTAANNAIAALSANKADKTEVEAVVAALTNHINDANGHFEKIEDVIAVLANKHEVDIQDVLAKIAAANSKIDDVNSFLSNKIDGVNTELNNKIDGVNTTLNNKIEAEKTALVNKINNVESSLIAKINADIAGLETKLTEACKACCKIQADAIDAAKGRITDLEEMLSDYPTVKAQVAANKANLEALTGRVAQAEKDIDALETRMGVAEGDIKANAEAIVELGVQIATLAENMNKEINTINSRINTLQLLINKRLTNIYFAPTTYVNGIEAINFASLEYEAWENLLADAPATGEINYISNNKTKVNYRLNPSTVDINDIEALNFICTEATNHMSRANDELITVIGKEYNPVNGLLTLNVKKNTTKTFILSEEGAQDEKFYSVALKATLKDAENQYIYSDWARLVETTSTAYIHDKRQEIKDCAKGNAHFYAYSAIYSIGEETFDVHHKFPYDAEHIALQVPFDQEFDLATIVNACDGIASEVDCAAFNLGFEFNLIEYNVYNEGSTSDATNQSKYAVLNGSKIKSTTAEGGNNRDAIGKTPVVQVILRDKTNDAVVDVRYFRVLWTPTYVPAEVVVRDGYESEHRWVCGETYALTIGEGFLNDKVYAKENMSQDEFHAAYTLREELFAEPKLDNRTVVGKVTDKASAGQSTQAHNLVVEYNKSVPLTEKMYNEGEKPQLVGYVCFESNDGKKVVFMPVTLTVVYKDNKIVADYNYNQTYWNGEGDDKHVTSNATLTTSSKYGKGSYASAMMLDNLMNNYIKNGQAPANVAELLKYSDDTKIVIDEERLAILPGKTSDWKVTSNGAVLEYKNKKAAEIIGNEIRLVEDVYGQANSVVNDGALLLVNYDKAEGTPLSEIKNAIPVKLIGKQCELPVLMDKYLVRFEQPLTFGQKNIEVSVLDQITTSVVDGVTIAGSVDKNPIDGRFDIKEAFGQYRQVVGAGAVAGLADWYIVKSIDYKKGLPSAKTNVNKNGGIDAACNTKLSDLKNDEGQPLYQVDVVKLSNGHSYVQFQNLHGNALDKAIQIEFPVTIDTKWRKGVQYTVTITVNPNKSVGGAKRN